jgi:hypothetical protein
MEALMPASRFAAWAGALQKSGATDATKRPIPSSSEVRDATEAVARGERSDATGATDEIPGSGRIAKEGADPTAWRNLYSERADHHEFGGERPRAEAERLAYGDLLNRWHMAHGRRWPDCQCAGCDAPIGGLSSLALPDDAQVHLDDKLDCLTRYGRRWRGEAIAALCVFGIKTPQGFEE